MGADYERQDNDGKSPQQIPGPIDWEEIKANATEFGEVTSVNKRRHVRIQAAPDQVASSSGAQGIGGDGTKPVCTLPRRRPLEDTGAVQGLVSTSVDDGMESQR